MSDPKPDQEIEMVAPGSLADEIINSATCVDRGVDPESGKRGKCHVFRESDICACGAIDLAKERLK